MAMRSVDIARCRAMTFLYLRGGLPDGRGNSAGGGQLRSPS